MVMGAVTTSPGAMPCRAVNVTRPDGAEELMLTFPVENVLPPTGAPLVKRAAARSVPPPTTATPRMIMERMNRPRSRPRPSSERRLGWPLSTSDSIEASFDPLTGAQPEACVLDAELSQPHAGGRSPSRQRHRAAWLWSPGHLTPLDRQSSVPRLASPCLAPRGMLPAWASGSS